MNHSTSPNRNSIFGWVKNLKKGNLLSNDSINEISDFSDDLNGEEEPNNIDNQPNMTSSEFLSIRPLLNHKSRSTNNVHRVRSNSQSDTDKDKNIRQNRDSFMVNNPLIEKNSKYFGVPLEQAINQASAKISIFHDNTDQVLKYGKIPIVVAKCGVYLKSNGLTVEGIFRIGGSSRRVKELQVIFNNPPDFGKKLNWDGYTVHDAASILRRYLNSLPEPLIPLELYETFREPLRSRQRIISYMKYKATHPKGPPKSSQEQLDTTVILKDQPVPSTPKTDIPNDTVSPSPLPSPTLSPYDKYTKKEEELEEADDENDEMNLQKLKKSKNYKKLTNDVHEAIDDYKQMVDKLPILSKQLLFYILDLLAMVQNHSSENLMSSRNLAAIFQPSILSHPNHDLDPNEYALSSFVVEFLIQYAYKLLPQPSNSPPNNNIPIEKEDIKKRQHSKSLSAQPHHEFVGFNMSKQPVVDNDYFESDLEPSPTDKNHEFDFKYKNDTQETNIEDKDLDKSSFEPQVEPESFELKTNVPEVPQPVPQSQAIPEKPDIVVSTPSSSSIPKV